MGVDHRGANEPVPQHRADVRDRGADAGHGPRTRMQGRLGKLAVTERESHAADRQPEGVGGDLCHRRVGAWAHVTGAGRHVGGAVGVDPSLIPCTRCASVVKPAAAVPMPMSWLPSRLARGVALRRDQPKALAPWRKHSVSRRVENGNSLGLVALGFVAQAQLDRIHAEPMRQAHPWRTPAQMCRWRRPGPRM